MLQRIREIRKNDKGFTLIELLIVIVILGVLAGIVVFAVSAFNNDGVTAACRSDVKNVEIAEEAFFAKTGAHTVVVGDLVTGGYLKAAPNSTKYTVAMAAVVGPPAGIAVTGTRTAAGGGGTC
jgi:general secretion pathway protein G